MNTFAKGYTLHTRTVMIQVFSFNLSWSVYRKRIVIYFLNDAIEKLAHISIQLYIHLIPIITSAICGCYFLSGKLARFCQLKAVTAVMFMHHMTSVFSVLDQIFAALLLVTLVLKEL